MPPRKDERLEELLRSAATDEAGFASAANDDPVPRRVALYAEMLRHVPPSCAGCIGCLLLSDGAGGVRAIPLGELPVEIGRAAGCDVSLDDPEVSRRHCRVWVQHGRAWLEDLASINGTFVNDRRVALRMALRDGDVLRVGRTLLVFARP
jgi:hypothetical protein